jgi:hypothetical protein
MSKVSFTSSVLSELVRTSIAQSRVKVKPKEFIKDCKKSMCLLQEDGLFTSFVHRSFQEFFAAKFLNGYGGGQYKRLVDEVITRGFSDSTFFMLVQIEVDDVLRRWCLPAVDEWIAELAAIDRTNPKEMVKFYKSFASSVYYDRNSGKQTNYSWSYTNTVRFINAINLVLSSSDIEARARPFSGSIYLGDNIHSAPEHLLLESQPEEDEEHEGEVTGRYIFSLSDLTPELIMQTGLPAMFDDLLDSLRVAKSAINLRLNSTDEFAKHISSLFDSVRE